MSSDLVILERKGGVSILTLNRPDDMNAISSALMNRLTECFRSLQDDDETRVAIVTGAGRAFCAGMDLKELSSGGDESTGGKIGNPVAEAIADFEGPIIAAVNGYAVTAGFELALACDLIIASSEAKFADTHAQVGMLPGWGLSQRLPRIIGMPRAMELSLTGNKLTARQANEWGLVNRVVEPDELMPTCLALANDMLSCQPDALRGCKRLMVEGSGMPLAEALAYETREAKAWADQVTATAIGKRRGVVQTRNRAQ